VQVMRIEMSLLHWIWDWNIHHYHCLYEPARLIILSCHYLKQLRSSMLNVDWKQTDTHYMILSSMIWLIGRLRFSFLLIY
jgi:hypothetical protein